jgi:hypothetical protein
MSKPFRCGFRMPPREREGSHRRSIVPRTFGDYVTSFRFWFESFRNQQSEFLAIASMVWLAVYLRQRWSPESKPVHASHAETGR